MALADTKEYFRELFRGVRWADAQSNALATSSIEQIIDGDEGDEEATANKRKRDKSTKNVWRLPSGGPVVPHILYTRVENALVRFTVRKRKEFVADACKYWTLKREARRGAALLKRLQVLTNKFTSMDLPRTSYAAMGAIGRVRLHNRIDFAEMLEKDLDKIIEMSELVVQREQAKWDDVKILEKIVENVYFPMPPYMLDILDKAQV